MVVYNILKAAAWTGALAVSVAVAVPAQAAPVAVANHSFESGAAIANGSYYYSANQVPPGWKAANTVTTGRANPSATMFPLEAPDGTYVGFTTGATEENHKSPIRQGWELAQTTSVTVEANTRYTLTLDIGDALGLNNYGGYSIGLVAGTMEADSGSTLLAHLSGSDSIDGGWLTKTLTFETGADTAGTGAPLSIFLRSLTGAFFQQYTYFDNVRLDATAIDVPPPSEVPEPAALGLLGLGLLGLAGLRRRRA